MVDIQSVTTEIRRGKNQERKKKKQDKDTMSASATHGSLNNFATRLNVAHVFYDSDFMLKY